MAFSSTSSAEERELLSAARGGDEGAFQRLVDPYRGELHAHCYRMLGVGPRRRGRPSGDAASRLARAVRFRGPELAALLALPDRDERVADHDRQAPQARAPDRLRARPRTPTTAPASRWSSQCGSSPTRTSHFGIEDGLAGPEARYEQRESIELAFVAALQNLPANQRAVLILREVLGFSAKEAADTLDTTTASVNSALQRARAAVEDRLPEQSQQATARALGDDGLQEVVDGYVEAWQRGDVEAVVGMLTEDAAFSMPPLQTWFGGRDEIATFLAGWPLSGQWRWRPIQVRANGQPALAFYSWDPDEEAYMPFALNVLTVRGDKVSDITAFIIRTPPESDDREIIARMPEQPTNLAQLEIAFQAFGLPDKLEDE